MQQSCHVGLMASGINVASASLVPREYSQLPSCNIHTMSLYHIRIVVGIYPAFPAIYMPAPTLVVWYSYCIYARFVLAQLSHVEAGMILALARCMPMNVGGKGGHTFESLKDFDYVPQRTLTILDTFSV